MKFLVYDTETGGLNPEDSSLLTAYFAVVDANFEIVDDLGLILKSSPYLVNAGALKVNNIDLVKHDAEAISLEEGESLLLDLIKAHGGFGKKALTPVGHNVSFDDDFIFTHLIPKKEFQKYVSYHKLDTISIANFLKLRGLIPSDQKISLGNLAEFLGIKVKNAHDAKGDVFMTIAVLKAFSTTKL